jgi:RNA polymerase sigma-70 factor (ECF subfamily)
MNHFASYDDTALLPLLHDGNEAAFLEIHDRYAEKLSNYICSYIHNRAVSEELVQDIFMSMWRRRQAHTISVELRAYLYRSAKNKVLNHIRSEKVRKDYAADFSIFVAGQHHNATEDMLDYQDLLARVEQSIAELPPRCQTAFRLSRMEYLSISEVAERMNISTESVENYITRALKHLRASLSESMMILIFLAPWE